MLFYIVLKGYVIYLCRPALLECWGRHLGGSRTGIGADLGSIMGFYFCVGGDLVFECLYCGLLGVFWGPGGPIFLPFFDLSLSLLCLGN